MSSSARSSAAPDADDDLRVARTPPHTLNHNDSARRSLRAGLPRAHNSRTTRGSRGNTTRSRASAQYGSRLPARDRRQRSTTHSRASAQHGRRLSANSKIPSRHRRPGRADRCGLQRHRLARDAAHILRSANLPLPLASLASSPFLPAQRPNRAEQDGNATPAEIKRPSWTPPGIAFPFIWLTISCLRAASSTLIWRSTGRYLFSLPLLALVLHLCVGDTWNCVTNVERRMGTSALGVIAVLASVYTAVGVYYKTRPLAGLLLAPSACWISIATVLTWRIWQLNGCDPLLRKRATARRRRCGCR